MKTRMDNLSIFILAGGKSSRMGEDKAFIEWEGESLILHTIATARSLTSDVTIVGSQSKFGRLGRVIEDAYRDAGPLGGLHAALCASREKWNLMLAVDTPFICAGFLRYLVGRAQTSSAVVTVPEANGRLHPLCAVYHSDFRHIAEEALRNENYTIDSLFGSGETQIIRVDKTQTAIFDPAMFENLNTPKDLQRARRRQAEIKLGSPVKGKIGRRAR